MLKFLKEWLSYNEKKLEELGIKIDDITPVEDSPDHSLGVIHSQCFASAQRPHPRYPL